MATPTASVGARPGVTVPARSVIANPTQAELRELAYRHVPNMVRTARHSPNKIVSIAKARSAASTYTIQGDSPAGYSGKTVTADEAARIQRIQEDYLRKSDVIRIDGYIGNHPDARYAATLWMTVEGANVAAMQQILYFPATEEEKADFRPQVQIIYTPGLSLEGYDKGRMILVDADRYVTRVIGTDYFGESKKGGLRMLNALVYRQGGVMLHSGAKLTPVCTSGSVAQKLFLIMGDSGTGKTTSTFSPQGSEELGFSQSIQDDFLILHRGGRAYATENGCFAITYGLREESEPVIHRGAVTGNAWLENVYIDEQGHVDFCKEELTAAEVARLRPYLEHSGVSQDELDAYERGEKTYVWTRNSRGVIPMHDISTAGDSMNMPPVSAVGILNRNTNIIPAVVRFRTPAQAAAYFMLGETMGTAASGADAGKAKRSPFTNVFFPFRFDVMCNRFMELAATMPGVLNFMMNTGWVGGDEEAEKKGTSLKVKIRHSSAILQALADESIEWELDPDFGYETARAVPGVPEELLHPRKYYEAQGRMAEYTEQVARLREERRAYLDQYPGLDPEILRAI